MEILDSFFGIDEEASPVTPKYSDKGRILFEAVGPIASINKWSDKWEVEVHDIDDDKSTAWIKEGMGVEYWIHSHIELKEPGIYVVSGIWGEVSCDYWGEYNEEWFFDKLEKATKAQIKTRTLHQGKSLKEEKKCQ